MNFDGLGAADYFFIVSAAVPAFLLAYAATPRVIALATRWGAMDEPDAGRRIHRRPIPRAGGAAVLVAFLVVGIAAVGLQVVLELYGGFTMRLLDGGEALAVFGGALLAGVFGFVDDRWQLRARWQSVFQVVLAALAISLGITIAGIDGPLDLLRAAQPDAADLPMVADRLTVTSVFVTGLWIVGMINSINFTDGLDGLSTGIALIAAVTLGFISLGFETSYQPAVAVLCAVLAGALAGFLPWNAYPARIFIGTTGVMVMGYLLAVLSILGSAKIAVAMLVLGVPIIDTFWVIIRRLLQRHSPFTPDRTHFHHRLLDLGLTHRGAVRLVYAITCVLAVVSLLLAGGSGPLYVFVFIIIGSGIVLLVLTFRTGRDDALEAVSYPDEDTDELAVTPPLRRP